VSKSALVQKRTNHRGLKPAVVRFGPKADKPSRAKICHCPLAAVRSGGTVRLRPRSDLEVYLFRNGKGIVNLNAEISDGALNLGVAKQ
jgi:hypothetical protein